MKKNLNSWESAVIIAIIFMLVLFALTGYCELGYMPLMWYMPIAGVTSVIMIACVYYADIRYKKHERERRNHEKRMRKYYKKDRE